MVVEVLAARRDAEGLLDARFAAVRASVERAYLTAGAASLLAESRITDAQVQQANKEIR